MKHNHTRLIFALALSLAGSLRSAQLSAQGCGNLNLTWQTDIPSACSEMTMTMKPDRQGRPYLYVAQKEGGLKIYDVTQAVAPALVDSVPIAKLLSLQVMSLTQQGDYLYLALGNSFGSASSTQSPGMAIVDVSDPRHATVLSTYRYPASNGGGGIVGVSGDWAYLGAMTHGLVVLDVKDKRNIRYVSEFLPDRNFPTAKPDTAKYNARGMQVRGDTVYLCFDAGGFRTIDLSDKQHPKELGRYSNRILDKLPRAYNNVVLDDTIAYVTFDYCGVEVLSIADPSNIRQVSWWNPWNCQSNPFNWFSSAGHANEIELNKTCDLLFVASGKSDLYVLDASNPHQLDSCNMYGGVSNDIGTWGVGVSRDRVYLSYVCTLGVPFTSNWTGVKVLRYSPCDDAVVDEPAIEEHLHYDIINGILSIGSNTTEFDPTHCSLGVVDILGQSKTIEHRFTRDKLEVDLSHLASGLYLINVVQDTKVRTLKLVW